MSFPPPPPGPGGPDLTKPPSAPPPPSYPPPQGGFPPPPAGGFPPPAGGFPPPTGGFGAPAGGFGAPSYPPPGGFGGYPPPPQSNGLAVAALVLGILSLLGGLVPVLGWFASPFALVAIGLGIAGMVRAGKIGTGKGMAVAGLITGVLAIVAIVAWTVFFVAVADDIDSDPRNGVCNEDRYFQDPDCGSSATDGPTPSSAMGTADPDPSDDDGINSDPIDGVCNTDRFLQDPDC